VTHLFARLRQMLETLRSVMRFEPIELDPVKRRLARAASIADLRRIARRRLPRGVFDYIDGGAEDERTLAENTLGFSRLTFRPRVLRDVAEVDTRTSILGREVPLPLALSPTGFNRIADPAGELSVARAAQRAELPYSLSTLGTRSIEEISAVNAGRKWFQVYVWHDRGLVKEMITRADDAGYEALILTVDTAVQGRRERDVRHGFTLPPKLGLDTLVDGVVHPGWTWDFVRAEPIRFANVVGRGVSDGKEAVELADIMNNQFDSSVDWDDVDWMRSIWDGPLIIKGIQTVEDAVIAADHGVEAIALSNHGGRQLDSAPAPIDLVAPVTDAVGDAIEVYCDGGVRRGSDIVKAVALGARACMTGRAYLYGLGAAGEAGVDHALGLLAADVRRTMALLGVRRVDDLSRDYVSLD
jgi:L-lactate dehydrogenase (cytochrome)